MEKKKPASPPGGKLSDFDTKAADAQRCAAIALGENFSKVVAALSYMAQHGRLNKLHEHTFVVLDGKALAAIPMVASQAADGLMQSSFCTTQHILERRGREGCTTFYVTETKKGWKHSVAEVSCELKEFTQLCAEFGVEFDAEKLSSAASDASMATAKPVARPHRGGRG